MSVHFSSHPGDGQIAPVSIFWLSYPAPHSFNKKGGERGTAAMRMSWTSVPWLIVVVTTLLWLLSFYELTFVFWPALIDTVATEETRSWYWFLFRPYLNIYLFAPFVIAAMLVFIFAAWMWRRGNSTNGRKTNGQKSGM
jgi:hypothetical protein